MRNVDYKMHLNKNKDDTTFTALNVHGGTMPKWDKTLLVLPAICSLYFHMAVSRVVYGLKRTLHSSWLSPWHAGL